MRMTSAFAVLLAFAATASCATTPIPPELASARIVYERASKGPAATLDPTDLHTAKEYLDAAEQALNVQGNPQLARDLGYIAERRTETAEARARAMQASTDRSQLLDRMHEVTAAELARARQQLATLQTEVQRRQEAERRAATASSELAKFASVKQDTRGMVIILSESVLFRFGKSDLLPTARRKLDEVATALTQQDPTAKILVEGHTDSIGKVSANQELSGERAQAVRDYLVSRGVAADRITAEGFGPSRPLADNRSPEGRANNRRVEIIVAPPTPK